ncbi:succinate dehydrogenase cytochrome b subunit [Chloroflexus sp.]|uniref:succinate dehydrogenase cytochrome b subunit n=1 Tax=Chloroflexus sp. TaxID=1904827 RepID=UPI00298F3D91|nr:succinate dehydrogenase cytochrome b subunit [Chloroflexus sp.]MCS6887455.1 succinate dehydrogenase cytochrome b subunit [Chloroflexus sp.]MDW8404089.1 succinate dehydrogenase cytochrome b subunit [Chloroflexus sp.]
MTGVLTLTRTSVGKKVIMALTGFVLVGFVVFHMYGNLKMYQGPEVYNAYAAGLRELGYPIFGHEHLLWIARVILLASVFLHIWAATSLTLQSQRSLRASSISTVRRYGQHKRQSGYADYTMRFGGVLIFFFIVYHILHLTFGVVGYEPGQFIHPHGDTYETYSNVVNGFQNPFIVGFYLLTMVFLGLHLYHGVWSMFQTLGWNNRTYDRLLRGLAILVAAAVFIGNVSFPLAVYFGFVA